MRIDRRYRRRRLSRSQAILTDVVLQQGRTTGTVNGEMTVISRGGAFVETSAESRPGSVVLLCFTLPPRRIRCAGIVRDCTGGGVGIEFTEVAAPDADRISAFAEPPGDAGDDPGELRRWRQGERKMQEESAVTTAPPAVGTSDSSPSDRAKTPTGKKEEGRSGAVVTPVHYEPTAVARQEPVPAGSVKSSGDRLQSQARREERAGSVQEFELQLAGALNSHIRRTAKFTGTLLASGSGSQVDGDTAHYTLFLTRGANLVVHAKSAQGSTVEVFRCFDDFKAAVENRDDGEYRLAFGNVLPAVAQVLGADYTLWID
jgi:hypothetical protein